MVKKRKEADISGCDDEPQPRKRVRNRASPFPLVKLYPSMSNDQKNAVVEMELDSLLDIKCNFLHSRVIDWFCGLYDKHSHEFVIPGRGRILLNEQSVYRTLGLPFGTEPVVYAIDSKIEEVLGPQLFPQHGITPKRTQVFEILKAMEAGDEAFKQIWVMYVVSTVLSPTTSNHGNIANVQNLQWCKFVADQIHGKLSKRKFRHICLLALQTEAVLAADLQNDEKKSYGKLEQKAQVANLMGSFASGMVGLMDSLVQGWTAIRGDAGDLLANRFGAVAQGFLTGLSASNAPAERVTRVGTSETKGGYATRSDAAKTRNVLPEDNTFLDDDSETDSSSDAWCLK
ncbi:hypothetical protein ACQ4PT_024974 [Festuca glaucescens]